MRETEFNKRRDKRLKLTIIMFSIIMVVYVLRLGYIQIINPEEYSRAAMYQQYRDVQIMPKRGNIYDRNGKELAVSVSTYDVWVEMKYATTQEKPWTEEEWMHFAEDVGKILGADASHILQKVEDNRGKARFILTKKTDYDKKEKLKALKYKPLFYEESKTRLYPYGKFAAYVLGHISSDNTGLGGIEAYFNRELTGIPGRKVVLSDAESHELEDTSLRYNEPVDGNHIVLTIDEVVQHYVEKAMEQSYQQNNCQRAIAMVIDPKTGDILAMCAKPDYNPSSPNETYYERFRKAMENAKTNEEQLEVLNAMWRNPMVSDLYEPGSVFKAITASAGIEEGVVEPNSIFHDSGFVVVGDKKIRNWSNKPFGSIDFKKAVGQSVNTVFVEVAKRLGSQRFLEYIHAFGFGKRTGISLPGEAEGIIYSLDKMGPVQQATMSFGQSISVTPIQMAMAVSALGNNGELMKPRLVKEIVNDEGEIIKRFDPQVVRRSVSKQTDKVMLSLMENVVAKEGGKKAAITGYRIAGKSGTAQKVINGKYPKGYYVSSFVGIAPVEDPKVVVLVITDEPHGQYGIYGGGNAAPFVKMILSDVLRYMGVTPNAIVSNNTNIEKKEIPEIRNLTLKEAKALLNQADLKYTVEMEPQKEDEIVVDVFPKPGENVPAGSSVVLYFKGEAINEVLMPDLTGKTVAEAEKMLTALGLKMSFSGTGKAIKQFPEPNKLVKKNSMVNVKFEDSAQDANTKGTSEPKQEQEKDQDNGEVSDELRDEGEGEEQVEGGNTSIMFQ